MLLVTWKVKARSCSWRVMCSARYAAVQLLPQSTRHSPRSALDTLPGRCIEKMQSRRCNPQRDRLIDARHRFRPHRGHEIMAAGNVYIHELFTPQWLDQRDDTLGPATRAVDADVVRPYAE